MGVVVLMVWYGVAIGFTENEGLAYFLMSFIRGGQPGLQWLANSKWSIFTLSAGPRVCDLSEFKYFTISSHAEMQL